MRKVGSQQRPLPPFPGNPGNPVDPLDRVRVPEGLILLVFTMVLALFLGKLLPNVNKLNRYAHF